MNKLKELITFCRTTFASKCRPAKNGNGINIFADITAHLTQIEDLCEKAGVSVITSEPSYNPATGKKQPAKAWIGKRSTSDDFTDDDYLSNLS